MAERTTTGAAFCVVLHDVAPATWPCYAGFVAEIESLGNIPLTLLVVPDYHRQGMLDRQPAFLTAMEQRLAQDDELVLHGYHHDDPGPLPPGPRSWLVRRVYTHEGEFYAIGEHEAQRRLEQGMALFARLGWPLQGFVPPAWLLGAGARTALSRCALSYTSDARHLLRLPDFAPLFAPTLVWSARSAWRRTLSRRWNDHLLQRHATAPLLRLGLHPVDLRHKGVRRYWLETIRKLLSHRTPLTKSRWLGLCP